MRYNDVCVNLLYSTEGCSGYLGEHTTFARLINLSAVCHNKEILNEQCMPLSLSRGGYCSYVSIKLQKQYVSD